MRQQDHITDEELVLALDGELDSHRSAAVEQHLLRCWECRGRRARFEQAITDYMPVHTSGLAGEIPAGDGPAAMLRARLRAEDASVPGGTGWRRNWANATPLLAAAALVVLLAPLAGVLSLRLGRSPAAGPLPDSHLTPGAVRMISTKQVCVVPPEDEGRLVPPELALRVFEQYRIANPKPKSYEVDYLISPALGGSREIENLWPLPYAEGVWTSRVKDALEDHLRTLVCEGKIDLSTAQHEISTNWIAAYQKHFRTRLPIAAHALFVKDSPWE